MAKDFSRKELKQQDEFLSTATKALHWAMQRRKSLGIALLAIIGVLVVLMGLHSYRARQEQNAAAMLALGLRIYQSPIVGQDDTTGTVPADEHAPSGHQHFAREQDKLEAAVRALKPVVAKYGNLPSGRMASFYLGNALVGLSRVDEAIAALKDAAESSSPMLRAMATYRLAELYLAEGRNEEAVATLEPLIARPPAGFPVEEALAAQARAYKASGDRRAAMMAYQRIVQEHPLSVYAAPARSQAEELAASLGVNLDVESD